MNSRQLRLINEISKHTHTHTHSLFKTDYSIAFNCLMQKKGVNYAKTAHEFARNFSSVNDGTLRLTIHYYINASALLFAIPLIP